MPERPHARWGVQIQVVNASTIGEIDAEFGTIEPDAVFVGTGTLFTSRRLQLAHWAIRLAIPAT